MGSHAWLRVAAIAWDVLLFSKRRAQV